MAGWGSATPRLSSYQRRRLRQRRSQTRSWNVRSPLSGVTARRTSALTARLPGRRLPCGDSRAVPAPLGLQELSAPPEPSRPGRLWSSGTYRCRSCRKRPADGWGRKCKPPPPSPAGSSCTGTRRGSSATPSFCPRGASSLLRSGRRPLLCSPDFILAP